MTETQQINQQDKKKNYLLWIILGILSLGGIGIIVYFATSKKETQETKTPTQGKFQQLQNQLNQIKKFLTTLNQNITQTEKSIQAKKTEQSQNPSDKLQTEINQLEEKLITYKNQKQKIESVLPKLEQQINNFGKENNSEAEQEKIISQLEKDIEEINKELGIKKENPEEKKPNEPNDKPDKNPPEEKDDNLPDEDKKDNPEENSNSSLQDLLTDLKTISDYLENCDKINEANPDNLTKMPDGRSKYEFDKAKYKEGLDEIKQIRDKSSSLNQPEIIKTRDDFRKRWNNVFKTFKNKKPNKTPDNSSNTQTFQTLQGQVQELNTLIAKINKDYEEVRSEYNSKPQDVRDLVESMFKDYFSVKNFISGLTPLNNGKLNEYGSDSDYQTFLSASPETQKVNIELFEANFNPVLTEIKLSLENCFNFVNKTLLALISWFCWAKRNNQHLFEVSYQYLFIP